MESKEDIEIINQPDPLKLYLIIKVINGKVRLNYVKAKHKPPDGIYLGIFYENDLAFKKEL